MKVLLLTCYVWYTIISWLPLIIINMHRNYFVTLYQIVRFLFHLQKNQSRDSIGHGFYFLQICDRSEEHHGLDMLAKECVFKCNQVINHNLSIMVLLLYWRLWVLKLFCKIAVSVICLFYEHSFIAFRSIEKSLHKPLLFYSQLNEI